MSITLQELKQAASGLPAGERAELARSLLRSLEGPDEEGAHAEWLALAERRTAEVRAGKVVGIPADEVFKNLPIPDEVVIIAEDEAPGAKPMGVTVARAPRPAPGLGKGCILHMAPDFDQPLDELKEHPAWHAFARDLPQLRAERPGQWVAYHGEKQLGFARHKHELYQDCFRQGWQRGEFVVFCIEPQETEITLGPILLD
jgi:putative addiction module component (TIGR02574 family)